jgi:aspartyl aminopeptidase
VVIFSLLSLRLIFTKVIKGIFMKPAKEITALLEFLDNSPTAWHAVECTSKLLLEAGFIELKEENEWKLKPKGCYFVIRNGSSLCAFIVPTKKPTYAHVIGSHTDSPGFKLKPNAEFRKENMVMLGLEIYGSPLISSWFNRDLGIAGRVIYKDKKGNTQESLTRLDANPVVIPQLAIHLDRQVNENGLNFNKQDQLAALAALSNDNKPFLENLIKEQLGAIELLSSDLFLFPIEPAAFIGFQQQMIASYRIDNLNSLHASVIAMCHAKADSEKLKMITLWNNEEIGSGTAQGANSPFLSHIIERVLLALNMSREEYFRLISQSLCLSVDLAHATHPNYGDKHEPRHPIFMDRGIVIKYNAQHKYASDARSVALIVELCRKNMIPFQSFVTRGDIPCGTTIGPINAQSTGMPTVDIGCAQLSMHSCRELTATEDYLNMVILLQGYLEFSLRIT